MKLLGTLMFFIWGVQAQTPDFKSVSGYPKTVQKQAGGQILGHVADANYLFCSTVLGETNPSPGIEKSKTTKAELRAALHDALSYCGRAYEGLTDASANETVRAAIERTEASIATE